MTAECVCVCVFLHNADRLCAALSACCADGVFECVFQPPQTGQQEEARPE